MICGRAAFTCLFLLLGSLSLKADEWTRPDRSGHLNLIQANGKIEMRIELGNANPEEIQAAQILRKQNLSNNWWGTDDGAPKGVLRKIQIKIDGKSVFLSRSAFSDLSDVTGAKLTYTPTVSKVEIIGGQTGTGYTVELLIEKGRLKQRTVRSSEMPQDSWERTNYFFVHDN